MSNTLETASGPLVYDVVGRGEPLLLIHGWGCASLPWHPLLTRIAPQFRCIVPDLPGAGRSQPVAVPPDMFVVRDILIRLIEQEGGPVHVIGHSMGGALALLVAAERPDLVRRLVVTAISLFRNDRERTQFNVAMAVWEVLFRLRRRWMMNVPALYHALGRQFLRRLPDDDTFTRANFIDFLELDRAAAIRTARSATDRRINIAAGRITVPTLYIAGRYDRLMGERGVATTAAVLPNAKLVWFEHAAHLPQVEQPDGYAVLVSAFLHAALRLPAITHLTSPSDHFLPGESDPEPLSSILQTTVG
ncbi:MAG: alpha/beta hydrolase [Herpetosiphonaceae bacterium]|nr:alpha/beta hydrolase [Herpetosiphonaceae bacterium]